MNYRSVRGSSRYKRITRLSPGVPGPVRLLCRSTPCRHTACSEPEVRRSENRSVAATSLRMRFGSSDVAFLRFEVPQYATGLTVPACALGAHHLTVRKVASLVHTVDLQRIQDIRHRAFPQQQQIGAVAGLDEAARIAVRLVAVLDVQSVSERGVGGGGLQRGEVGILTLRL